MRTNTFGEVFVTTKDEAMAVLDHKGFGVEDVYLSDIAGPDGVNTNWVGEVVHNVDAETVLWLEASDEDGIRKLMNELDIEDGTA